MTLEEENAQLKAEIARLKHAAERTVWERKKDLDLAEKVNAVSKSTIAQRDELVDVLREIAKIVGLEGEKAWVDLCDDPSLVLQLGLR